MTIQNQLSGPSYAADQTALNVRLVHRTDSFEKALRDDEGAPFVRCWYGQLTMSSLPEPKRPLRPAFAIRAAVGALAAALLFIFG